MDIVLVSHHDAYTYAPKCQRTFVICRTHIFRPIHLQKVGKQCLPACPRREPKPWRSLFTSLTAAGESLTGKHQVGFRLGRGCIAHICSLRQLGFMNAFDSCSHQFCQPHLPQKFVNIIRRLYSHLESVHLRVYGEFSRRFLTKSTILLPCLTSSSMQYCKASPFYVVRHNVEVGKQCLPACPRREPKPWRSLFTSLTAAGESLTGKHQVGFRLGRGCIAHICSLRQLGFMNAFDSCSHQFCQPHLPQKFVNIIRRLYSHLESVHLRVYGEFSRRFLTKSTILLPCLTSSSMQCWCEHRKFSNIRQLCWESCR
ncbi:hypothetical protein T265_11987 [Opisthorchis viverrini]|uniref:Uncharacterized protein n=1 Tax=Opisthorchis viverrini TaxID=6198 RepID=A0A074YWT3_OPIVI|nr:hypothetical protein T265_11987 [Opisthorchis viverrini]KER19133.1 hypothetical protein T265_11987 [Opisthorchis viverrini]